VAIYTCLTRRINTSLNGPTCRTTALVLGVGASSRAAIYALYQIGVSNILLWNRTREKAIALAKEMRERLECADGSGTTVRIGVLMGLGREDVRRGVAEMARTFISVGADTAEGIQMPSIIISTIYGSRTDMEDFLGIGEVPDVGLRAEVLELSVAGGVAVELAYQPRVTPLLRLVSEVNRRAAIISATVPMNGGHSYGYEGTVPIVKIEQDEWDNPSRTPPSRSSMNHTPHPPLLSSSPCGTPTGTTLTPRWAVVEGIEVLLEQAYEQTRLWTGRKTPKKFVRESVMKEFEDQFGKWENTVEGCIRVPEIVFS